MSKKLKKTSAKYKKAVCGCIAVLSCFAVFAGACAETTTEPEEETNTSTRVDEQVLKNGNFEFFSDNDGTYLLGVPDNWSENSGSGATASTSGSGVLNTSYNNWQRLTDPDLPQTIWDNEALETDDENYVNYNGTPFDLPFADPASAILENEDEDEDDETDDYLIADDAEYIANPGTHNYYWDDEDEDGTPELYDNEGNEVTYYTNDDGEYFFDEDCTEPVESNVLMIHNYVEDDMQGTETYYSSSTTLTLEANTAAKLSVWVKTSDLYFGTVKGNELTRTPVIDQRGAYIQLDQTVGDATLDSFRIENINTEILNPDGNDNGWVEYTLYVSACDYAATTITLTVGLGESSIYTLEGYAFFDDITYEKYLNVDEMVEAAGGQEVFDGLVNGELSTTCNLLSTEEEKTFRVDKETYDQLENTIDNYSSKYDYHIDLAISSSQDTIRHDLTFSGNTEAGLTADADGYVSSNGTPSLYNGVTAKGNGTTYLPRDLNLNIEDDFISTFSIGEDWSWPADVSTGYSAMLSEEIGSAAGLPGVTGSADTLVIMSARGAAYEAVVGNPEFTFEEGEEYKIVSFWVKTSDLAGNTSFYVTARQVGDDDNTGSFEIDTTSIEGTTINDVEDVYNGWVQCFALVSCSIENRDENNPPAFELVINYGLTEDIRNSARADYYGGWAAVTNLSIIDVDETAFGYAESAANAASLSITETSSEGNSFDDTNYTNAITSEMAKPANYTGINGASASTTSEPTDISSNPEYHRIDNNDYAGLINKDYFDAYKETYSELLESVGLDSPLSALFGSDTTWETAVGATSTQPLLIVNTVRQFAGNSAIYNYGFYGSDSSFSTDTYTAVSVKVKVSEGAVATVYLVDTESKDAMSFKTPEYTFWYDNNGNVLRHEPDEDATRDEQRANIAYTLRADGLYEDGEGNLYANLYNLKREYYSEKQSYYDEGGNPVSFDNLAENEVYYADSAKSTYAPHYLVTAGGDRVYSYASGLGTDATYNYFVDGEVDDSLSVKTFDTATAEPRYTSLESNPYSFTIDAIARPELAGKWITVNFFVHTADIEKNYRVEVWSGTRDAETTANVAEGSYVLFDYSSVSLDEDTFNGLISNYTDDITDAYRTALRGIEGGFASNDENIAYYEKLAEEHNIDVDRLYDYEALYYTFTLYDSETFVPFNENLAQEGETGYDYLYSDYEEQLAVLKVDDSSAAGAPMMNMFIDYSATDENISVSTSSDTTDDEEDTDATTTPGDTNVWLLASSIAMVATILIAIAVLLIRDLRKKLKAKPQVGWNTYNYKKNRRYVRTYVKEHGETPVTDENVTDVTPDGTADEVTSDEATENAESTEEASEDKPDGDNN